VTNDLVSEITGNGESVLEVVPVATTPIRRITAQQVSGAVITAAMKVHSALGAGLLESSYTACLQYELNDAGLGAPAQVGLPLVYRGVKLDLGYRMDLRLVDR
jgi:hypothetical protein